MPNIGIDPITFTFVSSGQSQTTSILPAERGVVSVVNQVQPRRFYQRARDSGLGVLVYWMTVGAVNPNPPAPTTNPNYTGTLSGHTVVRIVSQ